MSTVQMYLNDSTTQSVDVRVPSAQHKDICIIRNLATFPTVLRLMEPLHYAEFTGSFSYYNPPPPPPVRLPFGLTHDHPFTSLWLDPHPTVSYTPFSWSVYKTRSMAERHDINWFLERNYTFPIHQAIDDMFGNVELGSYVSAQSTMLIALERPHASESDHTRIAYTQSMQKGEREVYTVTSLSKYIKRHAPDMPDHKLRDFCARYLIDSAHYEMLDTTEAMISAVLNGPRSCMADEFNHLPQHPYAVYAPQFGWSLAVRYSDSTKCHIDGRCLCLKHDGEKLFVRSFKRPDGGGYSHDDPQLEAWLATQGYEKWQQYPDGAKLLRIEDRSGDVIMPYIDGDGSVSFNGDHMEIDDDGMRADNTNGYLDANQRSCDRCGDYTDDDDLTGTYDEGSVCSSCLDNYYTYAETRQGTEYVRYDETIHIEHNDTYYYDSHIDHFDDIVETNDIGYTHIDNAWLCCATDNWYSNDVEALIVRDCMYHPDSAPEDDDQEEEQDEQELVQTT